MKRTICIILLLAAAYSASTQNRTDEISRLRMENRELRAQIESLRVEINRVRPVMNDTWEGLVGVEAMTEEAYSAFYDITGKGNADQALATAIRAACPNINVGYNPVLKSHIELYTQGGRRSSMPYVLARYDSYRKEFEETFRRHGVPADLVPLCIVESAVSPKAVSRAGAAGMWQFMPETARGYGMTVTEDVDQRFNVELSTEAAAKYLKAAYARYGSWPLAVCSYNCGAGSIQKAMIKSGKKDFWGIYDYLPEETKSYLPLLIAINYILSNRQEFGYPVKQYSRLAYRQVSVTSDTGLDEMAEQSGCSLETLQQLNPEYLNGIIPGNFKIKIPK